MYVGGDKVSYQGSEYQAKWWTTGNKPDAGDPWKKI
ncbi:carbohydrate-binding protein [Photobacterium leiognathi]|nr:carbohydrate-binding protein [Photobacterium leiognathi]